ncbi:MAG TPA: SdrD B-like domain-containing protein, partial [Anaerolineae bacterium]|nr:SdrD B-like domain-containing protein [Anaerolineae bacterium]
VNNTAYVAGDSPSGTTVTDQSTDGLDPDYDGDNGDGTVDGDGTPDEDDPTVVYFSQVYGHVFEDSNGNGVEDFGEPVLVGISVVITDSQGITQTAVTDSSGNYTVTVVPGSTTADVDETTLPPGYVQSAGTDPTTVVAPAGASTSIGDDGYQPPAFGDLVWWDINNNGVQDSGEPGIPGVQIDITDGVVRTTVTDANGIYTFTALPSDTYTVSIPAGEFGSGQTLFNWTASPQDAGDDYVDSDGHPTTHDVAVAVTAGQTITSTDFGFDIPSSYTLTKQLNTIDPVVPGAPLSFTIRITNTGNTWLGVLPLQDTYNNTYLTYGFGSEFASPDSDDHSNLGVIDWSDLTQPAPYGFGTDLAPGLGFTVVVTFTAREDTLALPGGVMTNTAIVHDVLVDPDGTGPLGDFDDQLPDLDATDTVSVRRPTGVVIESFKGETLPGGVRLSWQTATEAQLLGFNLLQRSGSELVQVNEEFIFAQHSGAAMGTDYTYWHETAVPGTRINYVLEIVRLDSFVERCNLATVTALWWTQLPLIVR